MKITKAILTAGGRGTRLYPITTTRNKHLLPLANKPMIFHAIEKVAAAGITDIFINTNPGDTELPAAVGTGDRWGVRITFFEQTGGPQGIAHVVSLAESFIGQDPFVFYLSDNILLGSLRGLFHEFERSSWDCMLALAAVKDPERFGVPFFDASGALVDVVEKPVHPPNNFAVTGIYFYGPGVFFDAYRHIQKSDRGEYEISSVHSHLLKHGKRVGYAEVTGWWKDTGKPEDLLAANRFLLGEAGAGVPQIGAGTTIAADVVLRGPVMIGDGCVIERSTIGPYVTIGDNTRIFDVEMKETLALGGGQLHGPLVFDGCMIGKDVSIRSGRKDAVTCSMIVGDKTVISIR